MEDLLRVRKSVGERERKLTRRREGYQTLKECSEMTGGLYKVEEGDHSGTSSEAKQARALNGRLMRSKKHHNNGRSPDLVICNFLAVYVLRACENQFQQ